MEALPGGADICPEWARPVLDRILNAYQRHFDIFRNHRLLGQELPAMASFYSRGEKYVLTKRAKLWAVECYEHVLFFAPETLTAEEFSKISAFVEEAERELVKPHPEHMYTYLSAIILCQKADEDALRALRRYKMRKNYKFSLHGWCNARLAAYEIGGAKTLTNADGKELKKTLRKILT